MGRRPKWGESINGLLLLNKSTGISSNQALQKVKRLFNSNRTGHTGALDPLATGMLPLCFGEATKFTRFLLDSDKSYRVTATLGVTTDSGDSDGNITNTANAENISQLQLEATLENFKGTIMQTPPQYSALKHNGKPLYHYARQGITVEKEARQVSIYRLELVNFVTSRFTLDVDCSKGTYIRSLITDIGDTLGCGAHVTALHRTKVSNFENNMYDYHYLSTLNDNEGKDALMQCLLPVDYTVQHLPKLDVLTVDEAKLQLGQSLSPTAYRGVIESYQHNNKNEPVDELLMRCYGRSGNFLGIVQVIGPRSIKPYRLVAQ